MSLQFSLRNIFWTKHQNLVIEKISVQKLAFQIKLKKNVNPFTSSQQMFEFFPSLSSDQNTNVVFVQNSCEK